MGNNVPRICVSKLGQSPTGRHLNLTIRGNHITGKAVPNCIFLDDSVDSASIEGNDCYGVSGVIGIDITRHSSANHTVRHNNLHGTNLIFSGSGGKVYSYDNFDVGVDEPPVIYRTDAVHIDNLLRVMMSTLICQESTYTNLSIQETLHKAAPPLLSYL